VWVRPLAHERLSLKRPERRRRGAAASGLTLAGIPCPAVSALASIWVELWVRLDMRLETRCNPALLADAVSAN
jgi:hypothetical protein